MILKVSKKIRNFALSINVESENDQSIDKDMRREPKPFETPWLSLQALVSLQVLLQEFILYGA